MAAPAAGHFITFSITAGRGCHHPGIFVPRNENVENPVQNFTKEAGRSVSYLYLLAKINIRIALYR
jgi:hypothetical protein